MQRHSSFVVATTPWLGFIGVALSLLSSSATVSGAPAAAATVAFQPAPAGCAIAHCDVRMTDLVRLSPPIGAGVSIFWHDPEPTGSGNPAIDPSAQNHGNGCASNGTAAVCSYNNTFGNNVVAYAADGRRLWDSGTLLNYTAFASVPMIDAAGGVIAADNRTVIRFGPAGDVVWQTVTSGGTPVSPVVTASGVVLLATRGGPVSAVDSADGRLVGALSVTGESAVTGVSGVFETMNTPCVIQDRVYISMSLRGDPYKTAWLVALDVDAADVVEPLRVAWHFTFGGYSGASPTCIGNTVFFDGGRLNPGDPDASQMFAVRDDGDTGTLVWAQPAPGPVPSSFAVDPRGGFWSLFLRYPALQRRSRQTGALLEAIDVSKLVADPSPALPHSLLTISGSSAQPVLTLGTLDSTGTSAYVASIDLSTRTLLWKVNIAPTFGIDNVTGQFPIIKDAQRRPVVVFSARASGAYFLAEP